MYRALRCERLGRRYIGYLRGQRCHRVSGWLGFSEQRLRGDCRTGFGISCGTGRDRRRRYRTCVRPGSGNSGRSGRRSPLRCGREGFRSGRTGGGFRRWSGWGGDDCDIRLPVVLRRHVCRRIERRYGWKRGRASRGAGGLLWTALESLSPDPEPPCRELPVDFLPSRRTIGASAVSRRLVWPARVFC
jgi:hypothetical protein